MARVGTCFPHALYNPCTLCSRILDAVLVCKVGVHLLLIHCVWEECFVPPCLLTWTWGLKSTQGSLYSTLDIAHFAMYSMCPL